MWPIFLLSNSLWAKQIIDFNILIRHNHLFPPNLSVLLRKFLQSCWNRPLSCCPLEWPGLGLGGLKQQSPLCLYARLMFLSSLIAYILAISNHFSKFKLCHRSHQRANLPIYLYYHKVGVLTPYIFWRLAFDNMIANINWIFQMDSSYFVEKSNSVSYFLFDVMVILKGSQNQFLTFYLMLWVAQFGLDLSLQLQMSITLGLRRCIMHMLQIVWTKVDFLSPMPRSWDTWVKCPSKHHDPQVSVSVSKSQRDRQLQRNYCSWKLN